MLMFVNLKVIMFAIDPLINPKPPMFTPKTIGFQDGTMFINMMVAGTLLII